MRERRVWASLLGIDRAVVEDVRVEADGALVVSVRPKARELERCGVCRRRSPGFDLGEGRRRWRTLDVGTTLAYLEADAPRVCCREHGVIVCAVPWARHRSRFTTSFEDQTAWLAVNTSKKASAELMRIAWRTVGAIITRVWADIDALGDRLDGVRRIGIDEISYKRGYRYLTIVVDHDTGRLLWAAPGRDRATVRAFFDELGPERSALITHVSADQAEWIADVLTERCPQAVQCADPFHIVQWATEALDEVRRQAWNDARRDGPRRSKGRGRRDAAGDARALKHARYALWKNPENLTDRQRDKLAWIAKTDPRLHRGYLLKEGLRYVFAVKGDAGKDALDRWLSWARRCRIPAFVHLAKRIAVVRKRIEATLDHGLSNALIESVNTKIRVMTRVAFGFRSADALIALALLSLGGHKPVLPGR
ncbi:MAG TPA: ISL3 family transposase [Solirubrobacteraceae bacterium]|nr:ISL3 family transposase [Solirubrobacteraceae bacterium]